MRQSARLPETQDLPLVETPTAALAAVAERQPGQRAGLLNEGAEAGLDHVTGLVCRLLRVPVALLSLSDGDRQLVCSQQGLPALWAALREVPYSQTLSQYVMGSGGPVVIPDAQLHPLLREQAVVRDLGIGAYLGVPLATQEGQTLGVLCAIHQTARTWTEADLDTLRLLGEAAMAEIAGRQYLRQREEAALALSRSEARFRALIEKSWEAVVIVDASATLLYTSPALFKLLGYAEQELLGRNTLEIIHPHDRPAAAARLAEVLQRPRAGVQVRLRLRHRDGSWRWFEILGTNLLDEPAVCGIVANLRDVSEQVRTEEALREASRRKDEFLAMLAHELRSPLAPILNAVSLLRHLGSEDPLVRRQQEIIDRQVQHMRRLLDDLLDVSRFVRGKVELRRQPVELCQAVRDAVETCRPLIDAKHHALQLTLPAHPIWLEADLERLVQIFTNLLNNAAKYTDDGGRIAVTLTGSGPQAEVRIADSGIGMTREMLARAFELFTQADSSLDRSRGGLGLGLSLVRRLVDLHGGEVAAHSAGPGQGSEFVVRLPVPASVPAQAVHPAARATAEACGRGPRRVLIIEDNVDAAETLMDLLKVLGHEAQAVHSGTVAEAAARAFRPDVVFLDIGLPALDGYEVCRRLRGLPELSQTLIVALTGYGQQEDRLRAKEAGFDRHLTKPVDLAQIEQVLAQA